MVPVERTLLGTPLAARDLRALSCVRSFLPTLLDTSTLFVPGEHYTRPDVVFALGMDRSESRGAWNTGYREFEGSYYVFCLVGGATVSGFDYPNVWEGDWLRWSGKTQARASQPMIQAMTAPGAEVHVFWRLTQRGPFTYAGLGRAVEVLDTAPVTVVWAFDGPSEDDSFVAHHDEVVDAGSGVEGSRLRVWTNRYERDLRLRARCLAHYGRVCQVCKVDLADTYGPELSGGGIHVHHVRPLSEGESRVTDPVHDLVPVCPNCHAMLHRRTPPLEVEELRRIVHERREFSASRT